jgi:hypothetical protein
MVIFHNYFYFLVGLTIISLIIINFAIITLIVVGRLGKDFILANQPKLALLFCIHHVVN